MYNDGLVERDYILTLYFVFRFHFFGSFSECTASLLLYFYSYVYVFVLHKSILYLHRQYITIRKIDTTIMAFPESIFVSRNTHTHTHAHLELFIPFSSSWIINRHHPLCYSWIQSVDYRKTINRSLMSLSVRIEYDIHWNIYIYKFLGVEQKHTTTRTTKRINN